MVPITSSLLSWASLLGEKNDVRPREEIKMTKSFLVCEKLVTKWATSVQFSSVSQSCPTLCDPMNHSTPGSLSITNSQSLLKLMFESMMLSNHLILCRPLLLTSIFPSIRVFSNESALHIGGQSTGVSASTSVLPMNTQGWFPLGLAGLISLLS